MMPICSTAVWLASSAWGGFLASFFSSSGRKKMNAVAVRPTEQKNAGAGERSGREAGGAVRTVFAGRQHVGRGDDHGDNTTAAIRRR